MLVYQRVLYVTSAICELFIYIYIYIYINLYDEIRV